MVKTKGKISYPCFKYWDSTMKGKRLKQLYPQSLGVLLYCPIRDTQFDPRCYESPKKEIVSCMFEHLICNLKSYNGVEI